jgi:hypothetical protein
MQTFSNLCRPLQNVSATSLCHVFWALAVILLAFAAFTVVVVRRRRRVGATADQHEAAGAAEPARRLDLEQLRGFVYVGAAALALLAAAVIVIGLFADQSGRAEGLALLGFFGYAAYLAAAAVVLYLMSRKKSSH